MGELAQGRPVPLATFAGKHGGKMFGVLVVRDIQGQVGYLRAFSGTVAGQWLIPGFVAPLFNTAARERVWPKAVLELADLSAELKSLSDGPNVVALRIRLAELTTCKGLVALRGERLAVIAAINEIESQRRQLKQRRTARSCAVLEQLFQDYAIFNARGQQRGLRDLFAPKAPPGGAADCAGPKLLAHAFKNQLEPIALAEFWWEQSPGASSRTSGASYAACTDKCGRVLGFMLQGLPRHPTPRATVHRGWVDRSRSWPARNGNC